MGMELQSAGILFLEHGIHFSLNLVLDIVMNVPTAMCTSPEHRKDTLAPPSCLAVFYSREDVMEEIFIWNQTGLHEALGNIGRAHIQPA